MIKASQALIYNAKSIVIIAKTSGSSLQVQTTASAADAGKMLKSQLVENATIISAEVPDWSREVPVQFWDPGRKLLLAIRRYQYLQGKKGLIAAWISKWLIVRYYFWSVVTGAEIPLNCKIGGGLLLTHPNGIVIHPEAKIGVNCLILQQVTIGIGKGGAPEIAGHVDIGAGAKILGPIKVGAHAQIGANAVVLKDVPSRGIAVGVPARIIRTTE